MEDASPGSLPVLHDSWLAGRYRSTRWEVRMFLEWSCDVFQKNMHSMIDNYQSCETIQLVDFGCTALLTSRNFPSIALMFVFFLFR